MKLAFSILSLCFFASFTLAFIVTGPVDVNYTIGSVTAPQQEYNFTQKLTHFDPTNQAVWQQRFTVYSPNFNSYVGPVIIYIGGEAPQGGITTGDGFVAQLADDFDGMVIAVEHRFFGSSQPFGFGDDAYSTENLTFLTVDQSLADLANFITQIKENNFLSISERNPFLTIGGSYPGAMSGWFRYKYPHLTVGALASSGVINSILDFWQYDYQIYLSTSRSGNWCPTNIQIFNAYVEEQLLDPNTAVTLKTKFNAQTLDNREFLFYIADVYAANVQYGNRITLCNAFHDDLDQNIINFIALAQKVPTDYYGIEALKNTAYNWDANMRQWTWLTCAEFGWFQTANPINPMRSKQVNAEFFEWQCQQAFGDKFMIPPSTISNGVYGGAELEATNIVFSNGSEDPWQWASIYQSKGDMIAAISSCSTCGHCGDLHLPSDSDSVSLQKTRQTTLSLFTTVIQAHLAQWNFGSLNEVSIHQENIQQTYLEEKLNNFRKL